LALLLPFYQKESGEIHMTTLGNKVNKQHILDIVRMEPVWPQEVGSDDQVMHYYHITDALNRKWQTIGYNVSDAY
jgi:hypothetical protein